MKRFYEEVGVDHAPEGFRILLDGKLSEYEDAFRAVDVSGNGTIGASWRVPGF